MNYIFEYIFIPQIVANYGNDWALNSVNMFDDFNSVKITFETEFEVGDRSPFDWDNLSITKYISKELSYWLFNFPSQVGAVDAIFGIIVQYLDKPPIYFTLENDLNGKYFLGMVNVDKHLSLCHFSERLDENEFKNLVFDTLKRLPDLVS